MDEAAVLRHRLAVQRLVGTPMPAAVDVVRLLTCVQSQEHAHASWSLGMRTAGLTAADVRQEFDSGTFVRTHILRPTWHFVAAEDLRWIQALTAPRVHRINRTQGRQLGLGQDELDRGAELLVAALSGRHLTRAELASVLTDGGISTQGQRLAYLVMNAELEALICSGPMRGAQHTYALVAERIATTEPRTAEQALAELAWRFFSGHGPAGVKDFARWSSLTVTDARTGVELVGDRLEQAEVAGQTLWFAPIPDPQVEIESDALLVPLYDELTLSYPSLNFTVAAGHPHQPGTDLFVGSVLYALENVGLWRRTVQGRKVTIETQLAPGLSGPGRAAVAEARRRLAGFLGLELGAGPDASDEDD